MGWVPPQTTAREYTVWDVESEDDWEYLGTIPEDDAPVLYNHTTGKIHRGRVDHEAERLTPEETPSWELDPGETVGGFLERIGEDIGWNSLSEFARDHLEDSDSDSDG